MTVIVVSFKCLDYGFSAFSLYIFFFFSFNTFTTKVHSRRMNSWSVRKIWKKRQKKIIKVKCRHHWHIHKFNHRSRSVFWFYCINLHKYRSIDFNLWNNIMYAERWTLKCFKFQRLQMMIKNVRRLNQLLTIDQRHIIIIKYVMRRGYELIYDFEGYQNMSLERLPNGSKN